MAFELPVKDFVGWTPIQHGTGSMRGDFNYDFIFDLVGYVSFSYSGRVLEWLHWIRVGSLSM